MNVRRLCLLLVILIVAAACGSPAEQVATVEPQDADQAAPADTPAEGEPAPDDTDAPELDPDAIVSGLEFPTAATFANGGPDNGFFIAERGGSIKYAAPGENTATEVAFVTTYAHGDHGLTGILHHDSAVYVTYQVPPEDPNAPDCDTQDFGENLDETGCVTTGRVSKFPVTDVGELGPEEVLLEGTDNWCYQFPSHGIDDVEVGPDGLLYVSSGEGASAWQPDYGQFNDNPCGTEDGGAFRSQSMEFFNGGVMRFDPADPSGTAEKIAVGLRNPFRISFVPGTTELLIADVGWDKWEEINRFDVEGGEVPNFGWPCWEGEGVQEAWLIAERCQGVDGSEFDQPLFVYEQTEEHPAAITGVIQYDDRIYFGDFLLQTIWSIALDGTDLQVVQEEIAPIDFLRTDDGLLFVDVGRGGIYEVALD